MIPEFFKKKDGDSINANKLLRRIEQQSQRSENLLKKAESLLTRLESCVDEIAGRIP